MNNKPRSILTCKCGKSFEVLFYRRNTAKYCSLECFAKFKKNSSYNDRKDHSYNSLHKYVHRKLDATKPLLCDICKCKKKLDLANKSGKYNSDLSDWFWLCRKCHIDYDETSIKKDKKTIKKCLYCDTKIMVKKSLLERKKYCSRRCLTLHLKSIGVLK